MYTIENSLNEIFNDEVVKEHFEYMMPMEFVEMVPKDIWDIPLIKVKEKVQMPWGLPYISEEIVAIANQIHELIVSDAYTFIQLWEKETPDDFFPVTDGEKMHVGLLKFNDSFKPGRKMALVVPGGAYYNVAISNEGIHTAQALVKAGYAVVVMNYRCTPNHYPVPQLDLTLAIKRMRSMAAQYDLQDDLLVLGYSAGGHLVASQAAYHDEIEKALEDELRKDNSGLLESFEGFAAKPDEVVLCYPVISFVSEQHEDSFTNLTGGDETLRDKMSIELHVTKDYPKTFVWACDDDDLVPPSNASRMYEALQKAGVTACHKTYPTGGHGCATGEGTSAEGWVEDMLSFMNN